VANVLPLRRLAEAAAAAKLQRIDCDKLQLALHTRWRFSQQCALTNGSFS
jgi:hypothetical protein